MNWTADGLVGDLPAAIAHFHENLPGWWFSVGICHVSADATVAPDRAGCDGALLDLRFFDEGFDCDLPPPATMAQALIRVTDLAAAARDAFYVRRNLDDAVRALAEMGVAA